MRNLNFLKLFYGLMLVMFSAAFASCVDDNDDTEAPFLEVSPTTLIFGSNGQPVSDSQASFEISTNRAWKATIKDDKSWVTLSQEKGEGSATVEVSIPEGIDDEASVVIEISNKVGTLMSQTVTIKSGSVEPTVVIYNETFGTEGNKGDDNKYPFVDAYNDWVTSGEGSSTVTYVGSGASLRNSGKLSAGYEGASGNTKLFFGANASFEIQRISLKESQTKLRLTFGASYSKNNNNTYDNEFKPEKFHFYLSGDGQTWSNAVQYEAKQADEFWVFATSDFTLKNPTSTLYIKYAVDEASVFSIDDVTLATGNGGSQIISLTGSTDPTVTTTDASSITETSATLGGSISNVDISQVTEVGVQYIEFSTGTVTDIDWAKATKVAATTKVNPWTVAITNLTKDTQYAFRAYANGASGIIYGEPKTFVAMNSTAKQISIAALVEKMTAASTPVDDNYLIQGIICGDPAGKNYSYGTLYIMTKGATTAGNALSIYNNKIDMTQYSLGQEIQVSLQKDVASIYKRFDVPQVEGFSAEDIKVVSENNAVEPIKITVDQLASFVCMPVTIENVTIAEAGIWKEAGALKNHTFTVNGTSLIVNLNKQATPFDDQPFAAGKGSLTGIASIYSGNGQLLPRNLKDVEAFASQQPMIVSVEPATVSFSSTGGEQIIEISTINQGNNSLSINSLSGILSARLEEGKVIVTAGPNEGNEDVKQDLIISITNGNSVTVPIKVSAKMGSDTKGTYTSMTPFLFDNGTNKTNSYSQELSINEQIIEGLKLGTAKKSGTFTSGALGVSGNKKFSFYAAAWNKESMPVYIKVNGGGTVVGENNITATTNTNVAGTGTFTITLTDSDYFTFSLTDLTPESTITIATDPNFDGSGSKARGIICGCQLY